MKSNKWALPEESTTGCPSKKVKMTTQQTTLKAYNMFDIPFNP
jgi:hypothetical protein